MKQTDNPLDENGYPVYGGFKYTKQTAVEWLVEQIKKDPNLRLRGFDIDGIAEQAKQMEKEQMKDAYVTGQYDLADKKFRPQEYYNETYNK